MGRCETYKSELSLPIFLHTCLHCIYNWHMYAYAHAVYASFYRKHCIWIGLSCWHFHFTQKLDMLISVYDAISKDICSLHSSGKQSNNKSCFPMYFSKHSFGFGFYLFRCYLGLQLHIILLQGCKLNNSYKHK